jgi:hypothetical protein
MFRRRLVRNLRLLLLLRWRWRRGVLALAVRVGGVLCHGPQGAAAAARMAEQRRRRLLLVMVAAAFASGSADEANGDGGRPMGVAVRPEQRHHPLMPPPLLWDCASDAAADSMRRKEEEEEKNVQRREGAFDIRCRQAKMYAYTTLYCNLSLSLSSLSKCCWLEWREGKLSRALAQRPINFDLFGDVQGFYFLSLSLSLRFFVWKRHMLRSAHAIALARG